MMDNIWKAFNFPYIISINPLNKFIMWAFLLH